VNVQCHRVLNWMREQGEIDQMTALNELGIFRLASRINELRNEGHSIAKRMKPVFNRWGEECRVAVYKLGDGQ
jgi:hypothetical protein